MKQMLIVNHHYLLHLLLSEIAVLLIPHRSKPQNVIAN